MLFITVQNNMTFPWTQSLQAALFWSVFNDAGMVVLAPASQSDTFRIDTHTFLPLLSHYSEPALPLFSLSDLGTVTYYLRVSVSPVVRSPPPGSLPRPPMSGSEAFLCIPTILHTSPSIIFNHTVQWLPDDLFFSNTRLSEQEPYVSILTTTFAPFTEECNCWVHILFQVPGIPLC